MDFEKENFEDDNELSRLEDEEELGGESQEIVETEEEELAIVRTRAPEVAAQLARQIVAFVQAARGMDLKKKPGIAETLDWTAALLRLGITTIEVGGAERIMESLSALIKTREDRVAFPPEVVARLAAAC